MVWVVKGGSDKDLSAVLYDTGIEFIDLQKEDKGRIRKLVNDIIRSDT